MLFEYVISGLSKLKLIIFASIFFVNHPIFGVKNFILISAPGSGKGTFAQYMSKNHNYLQICPGDLFRLEIALETAFGKEIQPIVDRGDYVDEDIVCSLVEKYVDVACTQGRGFILDGFPRSTISFNFLHALLQKKELTSTVCFLQFIATDQECTNRILERLVCISCSKVYNKCSNKPECATICDACGTCLSSRKADTAEIIQKRLVYFRTNIEPIMQMAQKYYPVLKIDSECSFANLQKQYEKLLEN